MYGILKNVKDLSEESKQEDLLTEKDEALKILRKFKGRLPETFDDKKELEEAREEKYADFG